MAQQIQTPTMTAEAFWDFSQMRADAEARYELVKGELWTMSPTGARHGVIALRLGRLIGNFVAENQLGEVFGAETGFILHRSVSGEDTVLAPDVGFVSHERLPDSAQIEGFVPAAPDLAVEVFSPSQSHTQLMRKVMLYLRYGTRHVWLVDPGYETVSVYAAQSSGTMLTQVYERDGIISGEEVLPGFTIPVAEVFESAWSRKK